MSSLDIALNDLRFNYRLWKRGKMTEFISNELLRLDLEEINKALKENSRAFSIGEDIVITEKIGDRFESKKVGSSDSNYTVMYNMQMSRFKKWIDICKNIQDDVRSYNDEVDALMDEIYKNVAGNEKPKVEVISESKDISTSSSSVDEVVESLSKKAVELGNMDISTSSSSVDGVIESLSKKAAELENIALVDKPIISNIAIRKAHRLHDMISEVTYYYDKLEKLSSDDIIGFYEENDEYIEEDLNLDIDYLNKKLDEYKKVYEYGKPFVFVRGEEIEELSPEDSERYNMAYNYICSEIELAIQKAEVIKNKNFVHDVLVEPVCDHVLEMVFNEVLDTSLEIEHILELEDGYNLSMMIMWTEASIKILNNLKDKLHDDYINGAKIKVSKLVDGRFVVTEEDGTLENYETQLKFLDEITDRCINLNEKLKGKNSVKVESSEKDDVTSKYVVVQNNGVVIVFGPDLNDKDLNNLDSELLVEAKSNGMDVEVVNAIGAGLHNVDGLLFEVKEDGTIVIGGNVDKAEFHNQKEFIKTYDSVKKDDTIDQLMRLKEDGDIDGIKKIFKDGDPNLIWSKLASSVILGVIEANEASGFVDYVTNNYDANDLREDAITFNVGYQSLLKVLKLDRDQSLELDATKVRKPIDVMDAKKIKSRKKKKSLIEKFKGLKKWQKVAIVAGLSLAGIAVVGTGVYHLIPEVRSMVDGFIQNFNFSNFGQPVDSSIPKAVAQSSTIPQTGEILDYSSFGDGRRVFSDAYSAVSGVNPLESNMWFDGNPLDVFNVNTNEFMHLTSEQLHDPEFLRNLANDPNNTMLFGSDMANPDGFVPLSDVLNEVLKGGRVL